MEVVNEVGGIFYWVWKFEIDLEFVHKKLPDREPGLSVAEVFLL